MKLLYTHVSHTHTHTHTHTCTHTPHTHTHTCAHTHTHTTHTHTPHTHTHTHTHTHFAVSCTGPGFHDKVLSNTTLARKDSFLPITTLNLNTQDGSSSDLDHGCSGRGPGKEELDITIVPKSHSSSGTRVPSPESVKPRGSPPKGFRKRSSPRGGGGSTDIPTLRVSPCGSQDNDNSTTSTHSPDNSCSSSLKMPTTMLSIGDGMGPSGQGRLSPPSSPAMLLRADSYTETASCSNDADGESDGGGERGGRRGGGGQTWSADSTSARVSSSSPDPDSTTLSSPATLNTEPLIDGPCSDETEGHPSIGQPCDGQATFREQMHPVPRLTADSYSPSREEAVFFASSPGHQHTPIRPTSIVRQYFENVAHKSTQPLEGSHNSSSTELEDSGFQVRAMAIGGGGGGGLLVSLVTFHHNTFIFKKVILLAPPPQY